MQRGAKLLMSAILLLTTGCTVCHEEIVAGTTSPDQRWTTRTTVRRCGSLVTTNVYLQRPAGGGRLGEIVLLVRREREVQVQWQGAAQLRLICQGCGADVRVARSSAHGIAIAVVR